MRGRTLNDCFVILDEAQNTTSEQMKMFLTRLGFGSKAVITGDVTQSDLPRDVRPGLREAARVLDGIQGIHISRFTEADVVRHPLVQDIIRAYDRHAAHAGANKAGRSGDGRGRRDARAPDAMPEAVTDATPDAITDASHSASDPV
jgi:phosphate starvation-inducible PhoH-like protein